MAIFGYHMVPFSVFRDVVLKLIRRITLGTLVSSLKRSGHWLKSSVWFRSRNNQPSFHDHFSFHSTSSFWWLLSELRKLMKPPSSAWPGVSRRTAMPGRNAPGIKRWFKDGTARFCMGIPLWKSMGHSILTGDLLVIFLGFNNQRWGSWRYSNWGITLRYVFTISDEKLLVIESSLIYPPKMLVIFQFAKC